MKLNRNEKFLASLFAFQALVNIAMFAFILVHREAQFAKGMEICERLYTQAEAAGKEYAETMLAAVDETTALAISIERRVARTEGIYAALLSEEKKRRVVEAEADNGQIRKLEEARKLYRGGKYMRASEIFAEIPSMARSNEDEFFYWHALYLSNPMDSSVYEDIMAAFDRLKSVGYYRKEMETVAEYIRTEVGES